MFFAGLTRLFIFLSNESMDILTSELTFFKLGIILVKVSKVPFVSIMTILSLPNSSIIKSKYGLIVHSPPVSPTFITLSFFIASNINSKRKS